MSARLQAAHGSGDILTQATARRVWDQITISLLQHPIAPTLPGLRAFANRTGAPA